MTPAPKAHIRRPWWWAAVTLGLVVAFPLLASGRGVVIANTDARLLLDPDGAVRRSLSIWDPQVGMGTVDPAASSDLWPLGPWFWIFDRIGAPDWFAQRLLLVGVIVAAGTGVLFLARTWRWRPTAALAAAFAYALSPFCVLPALTAIGQAFGFAALPWLLALTIRSLRTRGWRHPAAFALVAATIGSVDPTSLALMGTVPVAWLIHASLTSDDVSPAHALTTAAKILVLSVGASLWWIGGAFVRATSGIDGRLFGTSPAEAADASSATEVLRGFGDWRFYAADGAGALVDSARAYTQNLALLGLTFAIVAVGLLGLGVTRWRHRSFLVTILAGATLVAVGAHPWGQPSPLGSLVKAIAPTDAGLSLRSLSLAVPVIALAVAFGIGSLVAAGIEQVPRRGVHGALLVAVVTVTALPPLWTGDFGTGGHARPEALPDHWVEAAAHLTSEDDGTRILEIPGSDTASYRWGDSVGPVTPELTDRPYVARERAPQGSAASADLLAAFDQRLQDQMLEPGALAVVARLLRAGVIVTRNDLRTDRYDLVEPRALWDLVARADDLGDPATFGATGVGPDRASPPPVAVFPVVDSMPIVGTQQANRTVILSGNGAGLVDAASAGLVDGRALVRYSADLTGEADFARDALVDERALIVTDTNRARGQRWTGVRDGDGYTEQDGGGLLRTDLGDRRLAVFATGTGTQSVAVHEGIEARATSYGSNERYQPEFRPFRAIDGDPTSAWRVSGDAIGERLELTVPEGFDGEQLRILQAPMTDAERRITAVTLRFDGGAPERIELDDSSMVAPGQVVRVDGPDFEQIAIEIVATTPGATTAAASDDGVGFAEIDLGLAAHEYVRMPTDLLDAGGYRTLRYPLALVQTRERQGGSDPARPDEETTIARIVDLPTQREYLLTGTVHLSTGSSTSVLAGPRIDSGCRRDLVLVDGVGVGVRVTGATDSALAGGALTLESCENAPLTVTGGEHHMDTAPGSLTGFDIDQLVWCSAAGGTACASPADLAMADDGSSAPDVEVVSDAGAEVRVAIRDATPGEPFWLVLGQSFEPGWEIVDDAVDHESAALVDGASSGFLVTPSATEFDLTMRFSPQNQVEIGLLLSVIGVVIAIGLALSPSVPLRPAPIALQEPLRRIRALSWEGALPTRRNARVVGLATGVATVLAVGLPIGIVVGLLAGFATRRERWRPLFTVVPAAILAVSGVYVVAFQFRNEVPFDLAWPLETGAMHPAAMAAVALLACDIAIQHTWLRRSDFR